MGDRIANAIRMLRQIEAHGDREVHVGAPGGRWEHEVHEASEEHEQQAAAVDGDYCDDVDDYFGVAPECALETWEYGGCVSPVSEDGP
eukprot:11186844-Lingulodinium_polyedra.AAC.1